MVTKLSWAVSLATGGYLHPARLPFGRQLLACFDLSLALGLGLELGLGLLNEDGHIYWIDIPRT